MFTKTVQYLNLNDQQKEVTLHFHLFKTEITRLEVKYKGGLDAHIRGLVDSGDNFALLEFFEEIVGLAYGVRPEDGESFIKSEEATKRFMQSPAYDELFVWLMQADANNAVTFFTAVLPKDIQSEAKKRASERNKS